MELRLLRSDEVAEILQVSKAFAYALMKRGEIPTVRIGVLVRVRYEDLERYINEKAKSPAIHVEETAPVRTGDLRPMAAPKESGSPTCS
jgi:excisionase family DNA binding protein